MTIIFLWLTLVIGTAFSFFGYLFNAISGSWAFYLGMLTIWLVYRFLLKPIFRGGHGGNIKSEVKDREAARRRSFK